MLTDDFVRNLHRRMSEDVQRWAGRYRHTERNIGIAAHRISVEVATVLNDVRYWAAHTSYPADEIAVRLHHRIVQVHPFPNGNGRHARLLADLLVESLGARPFSWGSGDLANAGTLLQR